MLTGWIISSCNKGDEASAIDSFLLDRDGKWQLASLRIETLHGDTSVRRDTLNTSCKFTQTFTFKADGTCQYDYYSCLDQKTTGSWQLISGDSVVLRAPMIVKDTTAKGTATPFRNAQVLNLGQNSLILQVVATDTLYRVPLVLRRRITRYGFIH